jgi:uncharacterized protein YcfL
MKLFILICSLLLVGCSTVVPVTQKFPQAPQVLLEPCKPLKQLQQDSSIVDLTKIVVDNYTQYYECSNLVNGWQEWYKVQQNIYKELK